MTIFDDMVAALNPQNTAQEISTTDINKVKQDVMPFLRADHHNLDIWSNDYFSQLADMIVFK